eukprot:1136503-Pleurochrysis_carterae.AAC.1
MRASVSRAAELRTAVKVARCPRARRRARRKSCSLEKRGSAKPWRSCNWARTVRLAGNRRKRNKERNLGVGYGHRLRGKVRGVTEGGTGFGEGCG